MKQRLIFFGTQDWAAQLLDHIIRDGFFEVVLVVTQPDQMQGRKKILTPTPVKRIALSHRLSVATPTKFRDPDFLQTLQNVKADLALVIAYGRLLPEQLISTPRLGTINVHPSLLPKWRGPSPVQSAIASGDTVSGVTIMKIDTQMDHGPLLAQKEIRIEPNETFESFMQKVLDVTPSLLLGTFKKYLANELTPIEQDYSQATLCPMLTRESGQVDWSKPAVEIERMVRAYHPWPGTWTEFFHHQKKHRLKILESRLKNDGTLQLISVQPEGKAPMTAQAFLSGYAKELGDELKSRLV